MHGIVDCTFTNCTNVKFSIMAAFISKTSVFALFSNIHIENAKKLCFAYIHQLYN